MWIQVFDSTIQIVDRVNKANEKRTHKQTSPNIYKQSRMQHIQIVIPIHINLFECFIDVCSFVVIIFFKEVKFSFIFQFVPYRIFVP